MFDRAALTVPALAASVPAVSLVIDDLVQLSNDDLQARSLPAFQKLVLWLLRDARDPVQLIDSFDVWTPAMLQVQGAPGGVDRLTTLITYMFRVVEPMYRDVLRAKIRQLGPRAEEAAMTIAEQLHEEGLEKGLEKGLEQGLAQGRKEGRVATLRSQLIFKFQLPALDATYEARLAAATPEMIDRYLQRVLSADSLAAVFED